MENFNQWGALANFINLKTTGKSKFLGKDKALPKNCLKINKNSLLQFRITKCLYKFKKVINSFLKTDSIIFISLNNLLILF